MAEKEISQLRKEEKIGQLSNFQRIDEFFLFTKKRIKRFNKGCFEGGKMKSRATSGEIRKFVNVVMQSALGVVKQMLTYGGFVKLL